MDKIAIRNRLKSSFMIEVFDKMALPYQLRSMSNLNLPNMTIVYSGKDAVQFMGQRARTKLPTDIRTSSSLAVFKKRLESNRYGHCSCRICNTFVYLVGYA